MHAILCELSEKNNHKKRGMSATVADRSQQGKKNAARTSTTSFDMADDEGDGFFLAYEDF